MFAKKNLVAAAALLAVAGAAHADVKLYGTIDAGLASLESAHVKGEQARVTAVTSGAMMTSYIGFAGSEDLGGGLKAEFALESFLMADDGTTAKNLAGGFWGRGSWVGLTGNFGRVALGQYDNPLFTSGYTYNPFGSSMVVSPTMRHFYSDGHKFDSTTGEPTSAATGYFKPFQSAGFDTGWVNSVTYESPVVSGFQGIAQYAAKESTNTASKNSYAVAGSYNAGPLSVMLTYVRAGKVVPSSAYLSDQKVWNLGASYDFGVVKAFGQYTDAKTTSDNVSLASYKDKNKIWQLGASVPVTDKLVALVSFGQNKFTGDGASESVKDEVFSIGADYALSKRTDVYAAFINNRESASTGNNAAGQSFAVGLKHNF